MSISIYNPYFYIIQHTSSGRYYAGVKYAKDANYENFLKTNGYQTSSKIVKQIIFEEGLESFIIRKIKVFETAEQALNYELRFLRRINASFNDSFLNRTNNSFSDLNVDYEKSKQTCLEKYGCEYALQSEEVKEKRKQTVLLKYGFEYAGQVPTIKEKMKQTLLRNYGVEHNSQSPEIREKRKQTCLENRGVEFPMQSPEVKEKVRQTHNNLMNRPIVTEIRKYRDKFKLKLGHRWFWKSQEFLDNMLEEIKSTYGLCY